MRARRTGGDHHAVEVVLLDPFLDESLGVLGAGKEAVLHTVDYLWSRVQKIIGRVHGQHDRKEDLLPQVDVARREAASAFGSEAVYLEKLVRRARHVEVQVVGDAHRLTQVLNNLLSNAVKFAEGGRVRLTAELLAQEQGRASIRFSVQDNGIGISPEQQSVIFERFTQAHAGIRREFGGSGLGLAIIKRLLNLQGSDIKVVSTPGIGSTFTFDLPFGVSGAVEAEHQPRLQIDLQGRSILLVDDQTDLGEIMAAMLRKLNLQVTSVRSGADALKVLDKNAEFGLVLMDLQMPGMDGYETAYEIRRVRPLMPIVAMTAGVRNGTLERVLQHGMDALVRKPLDLELLVPLLKQHLKVP